MNARLKPFITLAIFSICFPAHAELVWEQTELELYPTIADETAVGHFKYQNKGDKPVAIKNVNTSCGCTAASTNKNGVAPGEKGEITATFRIGNRVGKQESMIGVTTDDPANPANVLKLKITIPQVLDFQPTLLSWQPGETAKRKTITAKAGKDVLVKNLEVLSSDPNFVTKVEQGPSAGQFRINVEPRQTTQGAIAALTIKPTLTDGRSKMFSATARVMPQSSPPAAQQLGNAAASNAANQFSKVATAIAGSDNKSKVDACALLTSKEIESVQGEPFKERQTAADPVGYFAFSQCTFILPSSDKSVGLAVMQKMDDPAAPEPKQFWKATFHGAKEKEKGRVEEEGKSAPAENIPGVGDEAFWVENRFGGQLYALKGDRFIVLSSGEAGDRASKIKRSKELAEMVLKRL